MRPLFIILSFVFKLTPSFCQTKEPSLNIAHLTGDFYIYTTYNTYEGNKLPANGMYLITKSGVVLFDTPWDTTQFQPLLDSIYFRHKQKVTMCISTHWHSDRTAGLEYYRQQGIKTYTTVLTDELSQKNNNKRAEFLMEKDTVFAAEPYRFETYYPGEGHTKDNIVIWFAKEKILYAGCLIKGSASDNLGYLGDANVIEYYSTLKKVQSKFQQPGYIIISHSHWDDPRSLQHSIMLAKKLKRKHRR